MVNAHMGAAFSKMGADGALALSRLGSISCPVSGFKSLDRKLKNTLLL
jgi:hypothetical protein